MSFFENLKRLFGFSPDRFITDDLDAGEIIMDGNGNHYEAGSPAKQPATKPGTDRPAALPSRPAVDTTAITAQSAAAVAADTTEAIAALAAAGSDPEKLKTDIRQELEKALKQAAAQAAADTGSRWQSQYDELTAQFSDLNTEKAELKEHAADLDAKLKASETPRRAMTEHFRLTVSNVAEAEAEVEQYQLEVKSLQNKIKVIHVKTDDVE